MFSLAQTTQRLFRNSIRLQSVPSARMAPTSWHWTLIKSCLVWFMPSGKVARPLPRVLTPWGLRGENRHTYPSPFCNLRQYLELQISRFVAPYRACVGRNLFMTEGGMLGLCPKAAESGDEMHRVYGASVPFELRQHAADVGPGHTLVGCYYLHGFIKGEVLVL